MAARHHEPAKEHKDRLRDLLRSHSYAELPRARTAQLFDWIVEGKLKIRDGGEYPLKDAARAHADMESRKTTGKLLLVP
jgi:NADPH:quinone reductase-like Zn-dependent oxidoreductase